MAVLLSLYPWLKAVHVGCVGLTFALFVTRGIWMMCESPRLQQRWVKVLPHVVDSTLLASAILLSIGIGQYPMVHGWLTAKVVLLVLYVGLGMVALHRGRTKGLRVTAWIGALTVFATIVWIALTKPSLVV